MENLKQLEDNYDVLNEEFERATIWIEKQSESIVEKFMQTYINLLNRTAKAYYEFKEEKNKPTQRKLAW